MNRQLAERAVKEAEEWLQAAEKLREINAGSKVLYSIEMAAELSLKGLLFYYGIDFPKKHNILPALVQLFSSDSFHDRTIIHNKETIFSVFHALLDLRTASGYSYESSYSNDFFMEKANEYISPVSKILIMVKRHIEEKSH